MKTYFGMTFLGWAWLGCAVFCGAFWNLAVNHVVVPVVMAVVG